MVCLFIAAIFVVGIQKIFDGAHVKGLVEVLKGKQPPSIRDSAAVDPNDKAKEGLSSEIFMLEELWDLLKLQSPNKTFRGWRVQKMKPKASRSQSRELYILCTPEFKKKLEN